MSVNITVGLLDQCRAATQYPVLCIGQDFCPTTQNSGGTFANSWGHSKSIQFLPVKLNTVFGSFFNSILSSISIVWAKKRVQMTEK